MPLDDQVELFYLVDESDKVLGSISRKKAHQDKTKIHRGVDIIITNQKNQLLLQKRSQHKDTNPGYWTVSASGHVSYGESYKQAALRETKEELGITPQLIYFSKALIHMPIETEYFAIYKAKINFTPKNFDKDEIDELTWVDIRSLSDFVKKNNITPGAQKVLKLLKFT